MLMKEYLNLKLLKIIWKTVPAAFEAAPCKCFDLSMSWWV